MGRKERKTRDHLRIKEHEGSNDVWNDIGKNKN